MPNQTTPTDAEIAAAVAVLDDADAWWMDHAESAAETHADLAVLRAAAAMPVAERENADTRLWTALADAAGLADPDDDAAAILARFA